MARKPRSAALTVFHSCITDRASMIDTSVSKTQVVSKNNRVRRKRRSPAPDDNPGNAGIIF
jgi:hypothetical protein